MILPDWKIEEYAKKGMIEPFQENQIRKGGISYGLSSYGYDARVSNHFKIFTNVDSAVVDPKKFSQESFVDRKTDICVIPPNSFALARTVEYFRIPKNVYLVMVDAETGLPRNISTTKVIYESFKLKDNFVTRLEKSLNKDKLQLYDFNNKRSILRFY